MTMQSVCDAWLTKLLTVSGLSTAITHLYAPYSLEAVQASAGERHLAIWPEGEPDVATAFLAGSPPSDKIKTSYVILVWEDASAETSRTIRRRRREHRMAHPVRSHRAELYDLDNISLGQTNTITRYVGGNLDRQGTNRYLAVRFTVDAIQSYS